MPTLLPRPAIQTTAPGEFELTGDSRLSTHPDLIEPALRLQERLRAATGFVLPLSVTENASTDVADGGPSIRLDVRPTLADEAFELDTTPGFVRLSASTGRGGHWAVQALLQLFPAAVHRRSPVSSQRWTTPVTRVEDSPKFSWRGAMLDVARHFAPTRDVLRFIDLLAMHRLNTLHLHLTDDQGWRIEIDRYPRLTEVGGWRPETQLGAQPGSPADGRPHGGFYTQDDIREIVAYAAARGITVVPEIELPGHAQAAVAAYPELGVGDNAPPTPWTLWGVNPVIFNVEESTIRFLCDVLDEVIDLFPSEYICIGGDECPKIQWVEDERTQERMREIGVHDEEELQSWFVGRIGRHLASRGRRLLGWDEILEGGLADGATVLSWRGRVGALAAARAGHDVIACPEDTVYLDYRESDLPSEPIPTGTVTTTETAYSFDPVPAELDVEQARHVLGGQANLWTEHIDSMRGLDYRAFPRLCAVAEALWTAGDREYAEFAPRLSEHLARLDAVGVEYRPADGPRPWQERPGVSGRTRSAEQAAAHLAKITANIG
ncbi:MULTISPECIES: beta-N-acetylhexosaminidase [unclassified Microbacterium]|uniref:beta-N-acetylhexosaminidase n=1 Tax=unclassified Microbacterium TaxID=2609290 RepID=UPI000EAA82B9|nr:MULTISPECIES: beta-N-acetylhexosaminidase [unclassified Microbacterium]MBT2484439.1 beta-N-acetylhexosaminidase [Microbacterium sp. ISL-108]RKN67347.1 beta-N-acetylhexosaminidase [Microbacterium sp. CGR2]